MQLQPKLTENFKTSLHIQGHTCRRHINKIHKLCDNIHKALQQRETLTELIRSLLIVITTYQTEIIQKLTVTLKYCIFSSHLVDGSTISQAYNHHSGA